MATLYKASGEVQELPAPRKHFSMEQLQQLVGGWVEYQLQRGGPGVLVMDDEARLGTREHPEGKPINEAASAVLASWHPGKQTVQLRGDVVLCTRAEVPW